MALVNEPTAAARDYAPPPILPKDLLTEKLFFYFIFFRAELFLSASLSWLMFFISVNARTQKMTGNGWG